MDVRRTYYKKWYCPDGWLVRSISSNFTERIYNSHGTVLYWRNSFGIEWFSTRVPEEVRVTFKMFLELWKEGE